MRLKPKKIVILKEEPFKEDLLKRKQYADVLTQIVKNSEDGFTLSINADWGYGKTTFVKMWEKVLQNEGYQTIYFNAWESDFVADPMMALMDGLRNTTYDQDFAFEQRKQLSATVDTIIGITRAIPVIKIIGDVGKAVKDGVDQCIEDTNDFQRTQSLQSLVAEFKEKLANYADTVSKDKPLIIFVDELDRCRPDYAVQMLERIKHFFAIDNIIFVLSVDKKVLCKSIKAVYGGLEIDTEAYLRRFVDIEFDLPEPDISDFIDAQFDAKGIGEVFTNYWDHIEKHYGGEDREVTLRVALSDCLQAESKSLRDIEKYFNRLGIIFSSKALPHKYCDMISYLLYLNMFHRNIYDHLHKIDLDIPNMWSEIEKQINSITIVKDSNHYRRYIGMTISTFAAYVDLKEKREGYKHEIINENSTLEWFPKDYQKWFMSEISERKGPILENLYSHIELLKETFNWETAE